MSPRWLSIQVRQLDRGQCVCRGARGSLASIEVGKHAGFIVLGQNVFEVNPEVIDQTVVTKTVFAGGVILEAQMR